MLEKALRFLTECKENKTYEIDGFTYSDHRLERITAPTYRPDRYNVTSLSALVKLIKAEIDKVRDKPLFVRVTGPTSVTVDASLDNHMCRDYFFSASCEDANFKPGWRSHEEAIIQLQSIFLPTADSAYLLDLLSRVSVEDGVTSHDNGVSQTVVAKQGVSLKSAESIRNIVNLKPFRTFREVPQPESQFLLRVDDKGSIGLLEADGGVWKMEAKAEIAKLLSAELSELINEGLVVVLEG